MAETRILGVFPSMYGARLPNGNLMLERRFISGMKAHQEFWDGRMLAVVEPKPGAEVAAGRGHLAGLDLEVDPKDLEFDIELVSYASPEVKKHLARCSVALGSLQHQQVHLVDWANEVRAPFVYCSEYTIKTRLQVIRANGGNPLRQLRRAAWALNQERLYFHCVRAADGLQCNGTPTYKAYRRLNKSPMLFYDCRLTDEMLISDAAVEQRIAQSQKQTTLRLVFSGRVNKMKGADQLVEVARLLKDASVPFTLDIFGDGDLTSELRARVEKYGLGQLVQIKGFVAYSELIPKLATDYDLFLCCHPQGDPSLTYLEMMSQGVPIVGYANEAFAGVLESANVGEAVPTRDNKALCQIIARIAKNRSQLPSWSRNGVAFAREHTMLKSYERRGKHLDSVAR